MTRFTEFLSDDVGAVTIDWVAVTAGILLLGIMVVDAIFNGGVSSLVLEINETLASVDTDTNVGVSPDLNYDGSPMLLADGSILPVGSVVVGSYSSTVAINTPDGQHIHTSSGNGNPIPNGTTVATSNTLKLPNGSTVPASTFFNF